MADFRHLQQLNQSMKASKDDKTSGQGGGMQKRMVMHGEQGVLQATRTQSERSNHAAFLWKVVWNETDADHDNEGLVQSQAALGNL